MSRALTALAVAALLVMLLEAAPSGSVRAAAVLGAAFVIWSVLGYRWALTRGRAARAGYLALALGLGFAVFDVAGPGVGSTLLLVVVVVQAVMLLPLAWSVAVALLVPLVHVGMPMPDALRQVLSTAVACAFAFVLAALHLREQQARSQLAVANDRLRELSAQAEELATMRERTRVARDIHDGLGHHLTVVGMQVQAARAVLGTDPRRADTLLGQAEEQARAALTSVRDSVAALREPRPPRSLGDRLDELAHESTTTGLPTSVQVEGAPRRLHPDVEVALYRAAQEGLTNIHKHARAHSAVLHLAYGPDSVSLEIRDDGRGLGRDDCDDRDDRDDRGEDRGDDRGDGRPGSGFGLVGIRERAERLGGELVVESTPGAGVALLVRVPG